jgi:site-specific DNA-methyltransferase (adenine-specific)
MAELILEGDCIERMRMMPPASIAAVITSPPYNLNKAYNIHKDNMPEQEYLTWQKAVAEEIARLLAPGGHLFLNVGWNSQHPWRSIDVARSYAVHLTLQQRIAWVKSIAVNGSTLPPELREPMHLRQIGHFPSLNSDRYLNPVFEDVWHFTLTGTSKINRVAPGVGVPYVWADQPERFGHYRELHCRGNVLHLPYKTTQSRADRDFHPSPFPVELADYFLRLADLNSDDVVLDPFMGTGATLVAAKRLGLPAIGIDVDPAYCAAARLRLEEQNDTVSVTPHE